MTDQSVNPRPSAELRDTIVPMKKTSSNVPMNSAAYASGPRLATSSLSASRAVTAPVVLRASTGSSEFRDVSIGRRRGWYGTLRRVRRQLTLVLVGALTFPACGGSGTPGAGGEPATIGLDGPPNAT